MDPVSATPSENRHYAVLSGVYGALATGVAVSAARRQGDDAPLLDPRELALFALASAGLTRVVSEEKVGSWIRAPFLDEAPDGTRTPRGSGAQYVVGELLSCTRCLGSWSGLGLLTARTAAPIPARVGASLLAISYINSVLQSGFASVRGRANVEETVAAKVASAPAEAVAHGLAGAV